MKRTLSVLLCAIMLYSTAGCSRIDTSEVAPELSSTITEESGQLSSSENFSSELEETDLEQAEQLTACLVQNGLTVDAKQTCEINDEVIWNFVNGSYRYKENFPYSVWPEVNESKTTAYYPLEDLQKMVDQIFGITNWMPDVVKEHCDESGTKLKLPLEIGLHSVYGFEEMKSAVQQDGTIMVTLQLIETPNFSEGEQLGEYAFTFAPRQDGKEEFLRLTGFTQVSSTE